MQKKKLNTIWQTHLFFLLIAFRLESWFAFVDFEEKMMVIEVTFVLCQNGLIGNFDAWYLFVICNLADLLSAMTQQIFSELKIRKGDETISLSEPLKKDQNQEWWYYSQWCHSLYEIAFKFLAISLGLLNEISTVWCNWTNT